MCPLQVSVKPTFFLSWTQSRNVLCCQNHKKSLLEMTFGNPSRSAGRKGRGGESAKPSAASSGSSTNPMKRNEEMGRRNRGSSISSLFLSYRTMKGPEEEETGRRKVSAPLIKPQRRNTTFDSVAETAPLFPLSSRNTYPAHPFPSDTLLPAHRKTDKRHEICHFSRRLLSKVP